MKIDDDAEQNNDFNFHIISLFEFIGLGYFSVVQISFTTMMRVHRCLQLPVSRCSMDTSKDESQVEGKEKKSSKLLICLFSLSPRRLNPSLRTKLISMFDKRESLIIDGQQKSFDIFSLISNEISRQCPHIDFYSLRWKGFINFKMVWKDGQELNLYFPWWLRASSSLHKNSERKLFSRNFSPYMWALTRWSKFLSFSISETRL